jgi:hypothetical protein
MRTTLNFAGLVQESVVGVLSLWKENRAIVRDRDRINAVIDWEGGVRILDSCVLRNDQLGEKMTEDGRYFSGDAGQVWIIITPKG